MLYAGVQDILDEVDVPSSARVVFEVLNLFSSMWSWIFFHCIISVASMSDGECGVLDVDLQVVVLRLVGKLFNAVCKLRESVPLSSEPSAFRVEFVFFQSFFGLGDVDELVGFHLPEDGFSMLIGFFFCASSN